MKEKEKITTQHNESTKRKSDYTKNDFSNAIIRTMN